jgi:hypothetical protein
MTHRKLLLLAFAALLLASHPAMATPPPVNACTLLSQQEAASLFGAPLDPGRFTAPICTYFGAGGDNKKGVFLSIFGSDGVPPAALAQNYAGMLRHEHGTPEPFPGLGDQANFIKVEGGNLRLLVLYHNRIVSPGAYNSQNPNVRDALVQAMRQILQRF